MRLYEQLAEEFVQHFPFGFITKKNQLFLITFSHSFSSKFLFNPPSVEGLSCKKRLISKAKKSRTKYYTVAIPFLPAPVEINNIHDYIVLQGCQIKTAEAEINN